MGNNPEKHSLILNWFAGAIDFGKRRLTLSSWLFEGGENIFIKIEVMMLTITAICVALLFTIHLLPEGAAIVIAFLLAQRIVEFLIIYSRNFILNQGRIFTRFHNPTKLGEWLILMFSLNLIQIVFIFAIWYRLISYLNPDSFNLPLDAFQSLYFSVITFLTIGYGDIIPETPLPQTLVIIQGALTFYIVVIAINGLISIHFRK